MTHRILKLIEQLNEEIQTIDLGEEGSFCKAQKAIALLENAFENIKGLISTYMFKNEEEEIRFFKVIKPQLFCKLIYYKKVCTIETSRPAGSIITQKNYLLKELDRIQHYFEKNIDFYKYYRNGYTHFDNYYFLRGKPDIQLTLDCFYFERDPKFSTCYDFTVAKILANDMLTVCLNNELSRLEKHPEEEQIISFPKTKHTWTDSKTDLVELIYAVYTKGSFDHGHVEIKELAAYFCNVFNVDVKDIYRTYLNVRNRKGSRTIFLDSLKDSLDKKMDEDDSK